jgi:hypothetical protein
MALTRAETLEYLSAYSADSDQISLVLLELGEDPDGDEYPDDIVERAEHVFAAFGQAKTKALASGREEKAITVQEISAIASELLESQDISIPDDVVMALAQATVIQSVELADRLALLQERAFVTRLGQNREQFTQKLLRLSNGHSDTLEAVLGDEAQAEFIQSVAPALPSSKDVVQSFLNGLDARQKANRQFSGAREQQRAALPAKKVDVKAFLAARPR